MKAKSGFTLVEILIVVVILGILAAIVIPQFTDASTEAKTSSLCSNLQTIRSQIELYKIQHNDNPPLLASFEAQMTGTTDESGTVGAGNLGPYLREIPVEPFTGSNAVTAAGAGGWNYTQATGEFWAPYDPNL
jgi:general secretion pathway protein G